ncbi:hypothetical protein DH09_19640 [Bacillaceae bacterium JMAK1]|nr:hypothetical protein DH09_19640 [Bacillaceae bacterium JMAK1]
MVVNTLIITHSNFSHLFYEVSDLLNIPMKLVVLEVEFGKVWEYMTVDKMIDYDLVITSGAHLDFIVEEFEELTQLVPVYSLKFSEADLVTSLVKAKEYGNRIATIFYRDHGYDLSSYQSLLDIELTDFRCANMDDAYEKVKQVKEQGIYSVVSTSSICEVAKQLEIPNTLVYSLDTLRAEIMKAFQFAISKKNLVVNKQLVKKLFDIKSEPAFFVDQDLIVLDFNFAALHYLKDTSKAEIVGRYIHDLINIPKSFLTNDETYNSKIQSFPITYQERIYGHLVTLGDRSTNYIHKKRLTLHSKYKFANIVHESTVMKKVVAKSIQYATNSDAPILIYGETGTGKELLAHSVHMRSERRDRPFLPVNCAAIPSNILESELFGYEEGAFTGARKNGKAGYFELAQHGTIFLDEIGEIPLELQVRLLRVLQEKEIIRLGGQAIVPLDVRIIAATNQSLLDLIHRGEFREDLYYRINVLNISIPPLRERLKDILFILVHLLIQNGVEETQARDMVYANQSLLQEYNWPGNIRELENFVLRLTALAPPNSTTTVLIESFNETLTEFITLNTSDALTRNIERTSLKHVDLTVQEKSNIVKLLLEHQGDKSKVSEELGISRTTLWRKMKKYSILD